MTGANGVNNDDCSMVTDSDLHYPSPAGVEKIHGVVALCGE